MYIYNKTRETFVATEATVADSYLRRLVGLLGKTKRWAQLGRGLWIVPSRGIHTIGMLFPIDLIFLSKEKEVVHVEEHVRPFRISAVSLRAMSVLGTPGAHDFPHGHSSGRPAGNRATQPIASRRPTDDAVRHEKALDPRWQVGAGADQASGVYVQLVRVKAKRNYETQ